VAFQATYFHPSGQSTVSLDSLCSGSVQIKTDCPDPELA
jgi:hypothetical protein